MAKGFCCPLLLSCKGEGGGEEGREGGEEEGREGGGKEGRRGEWEGRRGGGESGRGEWEGRGGGEGRRDSRLHYTRSQLTHTVPSFEVNISFPHLKAVERSEVVELDHVLSLPAEEPVGVAFSCAVGLQECKDVLGHLQHFLVGSKVRKAQQIVGRVQRLISPEVKIGSSPNKGCLQFLTSRISMETGNCQLFDCILSSNTLLLICLKVF